MRHPTHIATTLLAFGLALLITGCDDGDDPSGTVDAADASVATDTGAPDSAATTTADPDATDAPDTEAPDTSPPIDPDAIVLPAERPAIIRTSSTFIGDWDLAKGKETTRCVVKRLDNDEVMWVSAVRTQLARGSHHLIVYKSDETEERTEPFSCDPFIETLKGQTFPLMITQVKEETLSFPNGIAFRFEPNQMVRLEAHFLNYFQEPITAHADVHFDAIAAEDVVSEANMLFYGNPDISIPPNSEYSVPWRHLTVPDGTEVFAITGHTHAYGTNVEIAVSTSVADEGTPIYPGEEPFSWDEAPVEYFSPAIRFTEGQGFRYRCSWENTSDREVGFGESASSEMCFMWAYYYPSQGYRICVSPGSIGGGIAGEEICCPGHALCDYIRSAF